MSEVEQYEETNRAELLKQLNTKKKYIVFFMSLLFIVIGVVIMLTYFDIQTIHSKDFIINGLVFTFITTGGLNILKLLYNTLFKK